MAQVRISNPAGYFNSATLTQFGTPGGTTLVQLIDGVTSAGGNGQYEVNFVLNELLVYGAGISAPNIHVVKLTAGIPSTYDTRVLKMYNFLVVGGGIVGNQDVRVVGGVGNQNIQDGTLAATKLDPATFQLQNLTDVSVVDSTTPDGDILTFQHSTQKWIAATPGGGGTVTSVGLALPGEFTVSGSPVTSTGTLTAAWASELQNKVFAAPSGSTGTPAFRLLVAGDIPALDFSKITTGIVPIAQGGTGTTTPALVAGTGISITGSWPDQTITNSSPSSGGTVTSVALGLPGEFTVSGSPVTTAGTLTAAWASEAQNKVFAAPSGSAGTPAFRLLVASDIPSLSYVTSVALTAPSIFTVSGSPVTSSGTLSFSLNTQTANQVFAGPSSGGATAPTFRALVATDIPTFPASQITSGQLALARGGTGSDLSGTGGSSQVLKQVSIGAAVTVAQLAFSDISGSVAAAQLPNPTASTLGGIESLAAVTSKWINTISTSGVPSATQPASSDLSDTTGLTSWTPTDQSGASLSFTSDGKYQKLAASIYYVYGHVIFPTTSDTSLVKISLPFTPNSGLNQSVELFTNVGVILSGQLDSSGVLLVLNTLTGATYNNNQLSGKELRWTIVYTS